ncbi:translationally-controlled tumor protein homolog [Physella acuta]|uniref:translationally-controlled tumor protein homolog n=1 Tax=Physella acuta TaxID=109671 RepID=UPI0027DB98C3|nr:translationally-controlled tumor protein homolog [Physella acuta]
MRVYKCIVTGDELFTDTYPIELKDGLYKIKGKYVTSSDKVDDSLLGASAEEQEKGADENSTSGIDVVLDKRLMPTAFGSKKEFQAYFKDFVKRIEENKKENDAKFDVDAWRKEIQNTFKIVCANFDYAFYTASSSNLDGSIALVRWEAPAGETDEIPFVYFFADGVKEEKVEQ